MGGPSFHALRCAHLAHPWGFGFGPNGKTTRIQPLDVPAGVGPDTAVSEALLDEFRSLVGKILFVATSTRPDLVGSLGVLASAVTDLRGRHVLDINRLVSQIHTIPYPRLLVRFRLGP